MLCPMIIVSGSNKISRGIRTGSAFIFPGLRLMHSIQQRDVVYLYLSRPLYTSNDSRTTYNFSSVISASVNLHVTNLTMPSGGELTQNFYSDIYKFLRVSFFKEFIYI